MPNHVSSNLTITGPVADVRRFVSLVDRSNDTSEKPFDFSGVVTMPDELRGTSSPVRIQTQEEIDNMWAEWNQRKNAGELKDYELRDGKPWGLGITQAASDALIAKYGTDNWYDWALNNWGTKWGAYDATEWDVTEGENGNATASISYNTAWSPATAFYINASEKFPTLAFDTQYADEGGGFVCETSYENGEVTENIDYDWDSADGIEVREAVGYGPLPEDEEETEELTDEQTVTE
jgi:hypothetical protein